MYAFKMTDGAIHLLQDRFMYTLFESEILGGLIFFITQHAHEQEVQIEGKAYKKVLMYIDQNKVPAMHEHIPHSNFVLLTEQEI